MPPILRTTARVLGAAAVGLAGAWLALLVAGRIHHDVGPFQVEYFARPGRAVTEIVLPPLGRIEADTHRSPVHVTATVTSVDPERAASLVAERGVEGLVLQVEDDAVRALGAHAGRAMAVAAAGALVLALLAFRTRWRTVGVAAVGGWVLVAATAGVARVTFRPEAFLEPRFAGSLTLAAQLVGPIQQAAGRLEAFRSELDRLVRQNLDAYGDLAVGPGPGEDALVVLHISDIHASPLGMDFAQRLAGAFEADLVIDTGDIVSFGTPLEAGILRRIEGFGIPYVFVRGNHDGEGTGRRIAAIENAVVLEHEAVTVRGLTIYGAPHPLFTPDPELGLTDQEIEETARAAGQPVAEGIAGAPHPPDVLALHDDRQGLASAGLVPLVVSGHFHRFGSTVVDETLFLRVATTGGGGLDTFIAEHPIPLGAQILYFEGDPPRPVAYDVVALDPETRNLVAERTLVTEVPEPEPAPTG